MTEFEVKVGGQGSGVKTAYVWNTGLSSSFLERESPTISIGVCCRCQGPRILLSQGKK